MAVWIGVYGRKTEDRTWLRENYPRLSEVFQQRLKQADACAGMCTAGGGHNGFASDYYIYVNPSDGQCMLVRDVLAVSLHTCSAPNSIEIYVAGKSNVSYTLSDFLFPDSL